MGEERIEASTIVKDLGMGAGKVALETSSIGIVYFLLFIGLICLACCLVTTGGTVILGVGAIVGAFYQTSLSASFIMIAIGLLGISFIIPTGILTKYAIKKFSKFMTTVKQVKI